jgi:hypothetical protein
MNTWHDDNELRMKLQGILRSNERGGLSQSDGCLHSLPAGLLVHESFQQGMIEGVTGLVGYDMADNRHAEEGKISNAVKYLVTHEFVCVSKAFWIQYSILVDDHSIFQRSALSESVALQIVNFMEETKGPRTADLLLKKTINK